MAAPVFALAGGSFIFLAFLIVLLGGIVFAYYSRTGSEIEQRPYHDRGDTDPTAFRDVSQDVRNWSHGTGGAHRRNKPAPRTPGELAEALDPQTQERLTAWREHLETGMAAGLVAGVDERRDHVRGAPDAGVTIVAYADFQCPSCREAEWEIRGLQKELGDDQVRYVFRHFPIADAHEGALDAAQAVEFAAEQDRFWEMHDAIYRSSRPPSPQSLGDAARTIALDADGLARALQERRYAERVAEDFNSGVRSGVDGTPTLFVNGTRHDGDTDKATLRTAVEAAAATA